MGRPASGAYQQAKAKPDGKPGSSWTPCPPSIAERMLNRYHDIQGGRLALAQGRVLRCGTALLRLAPRAETKPEPGGKGKGGSSSSAKGTGSGTPPAGDG